MSQLGRKLIAASSVLLVLLGAILFAVRQRECPQFRKRFLRKILMQSYRPGPDVTFTWQMAGSGTTQDGGRFDTTHYRSSDCVDLSVTYYDFASEMAATTWVVSERNTNRAPVDAGRLSGQAGGGDRTVLYSRDSGQYEVLRRLGARLINIESSSLDHALEYENRVFH